MTTDCTQYMYIPVVSECKSWPPCGL